MDLDRLVQARRTALGVIIQTTTDRVSALETLLDAARRELRAHIGEMRVIDPEWTPERNTNRRQLERQRKGK